MHLIPGVQSGFGNLREHREEAFTCVSATTGGCVAALRGCLFGESEKDVLSSDWWRWVEGSTGSEADCLRCIMMGNGAAPAENGYIWCLYRCKCEFVLVAG